MVPDQALVPLRLGESVAGANGRLAGSGKALGRMPPGNATWQKGYLLTKCHGLFLAFQAPRGVGFRDAAAAYCRGDPLKRPAVGAPADSLSRPQSQACGDNNDHPTHPCTLLESPRSR